MYKRGGTMFVSSRALIVLFTLIIGVGATPADEVLVTATVYNADPRQCNADYLTTASGKKINESNPQGLVNNDIRLGKWNNVKLEIWRPKKN